MKTTKTNKWMTTSAAMLATAVVLPMMADQATSSANLEKHYTGTVVSIDNKDLTFKVRGFILSKHFNVGSACSYKLLDETPGAFSDLRPGERVAINYQNANGVLVADRVEQQPMSNEGMIKAIDPTAHTLTLHMRGLDKTFYIANDCGVVLADDKPGTVADIQTGDHVKVIYETPNDVLVARQIAQSSVEFTGTLTAIDLENKTLKAKTPFTSKKFNVGDDCVVVINGKPDGHLDDLRPDERLTISYDEINGVNVANRIAPAQNHPESVAVNSGTTAGN